MKPYISLLLLAAFFSCVLSCNLSDGSGNSGEPNSKQGNSETSNNKPGNPETPNNKPGEPETGGGGDIPLILAMYQMEVVNNTDSAVSVFVDDFYYKLNNDDDHYLRVYNDALCTVAGNTIGTAEFSWVPKRRLDNGSDPCDPSSLAWPTVEEMKARFRPGINAFCLRIRIGGEECYLAGWPQSLELPHLLYDYDRDDFVLDTSKIVQYGIGYGNNKEVRVMRVDAVDLVYVPFIISYDHDGQTEEHDFDNTEIVYGKAVLTIDAPDKITFQTIALSLSPDDL